MRSFLVSIVIMIFCLSILMMNVSSIRNEIEEDVLGPTAGEPEIDIQIAPVNYQAYVSPSDTGSVYITGTVLCEIPPMVPNNVYCVVELVVSAGGWSTSLPPSLTFSRAQQQQAFTISVYVPINTPPDESKDIMISGSWYYSPGNQGGTTESESAYIEVMPFVYLDLKWDAVNTTLYLGEKKTYDVEIFNLGTMTADVHVTSNSDSGEVDIKLSRTDLEIPPHQREKITITFGQSSGSQGAHKITLTAAFNKNINQDPIHVSFTLFTKEKTVADKLGPYIVPGVMVLILAVIVIMILIYIRKRRYRSDRMKVTEENV